MLFEYIEKLRRKPENVRTRFALFFSGGFVGAIFIIWLIGTLSVMKSENISGSKTISTIAGPLSAVKESFIKSYYGMKEQLGGMKTQFDSLAGLMSSSSVDIYVASSSPKNAVGQDAPTSADTGGNF